MAIFIPRKKEFWQRKPTDNVELLDSYSPIVVAAPENNIFNYATNTNGINTGVTIDGSAFNFNKALDSHIEFNGVARITTGYSFIAVSTGISTDTNYSNIFNLGSRVQLRHDTSSYYFYHYDSIGWKLAKFPAGYKDNIKIILVGVFDGSSISLYSDGQSVASDIADSPIGSTARLNLGVDNAGTSTAFDGDIEFVTIVKDVFPTEKAKELSLAPYQILKPRKKYFALGAAPVITFQPSWARNVNNLIGGL